MKKLIVLVVVVFGFVASSFAQSASADASAGIIGTATITKVSGKDMNFGQIYSNLAGGSIVLTPSSAGTVTPTGLSLKASSGASAAAFLVTGYGGNPNISWTTGSIILSDGASHTMTLSAITCTNNGGTALTQGAALTLTGNVATAYVGGTLTVGANQVIGTYKNTGGISVTITYP